MRRALLAVALTAAALSFAAPAVSSNPSPAKKEKPNQRPMQIPSSSSPADPSFPQPGSGLFSGSSGGNVPPMRYDGEGVGKGRGLSIADALTLERKAGIWWEYARDIDSIDSQLSNLQSSKWTVFVPTDTAIRSLPRKPHQGADGATPSDEKEARENVVRFLGAHIVPDMVDLPTTKKVSTLGGKVEVEVQRTEGGEEKEQGWVVQPGNAKVVWTKDVMNGRILLMDGVIPYDQ